MNSESQENNSLEEEIQRKTLQEQMKKILSKQFFNKSNPSDSQSPQQVQSSSPLESNQSEFKNDENQESQEYSSQEYQKKKLDIERENILNKLKNKLMTQYKTNKEERNSYSSDSQEFVELDAEVCITLENLNTVQEEISQPLNDFEEQLNYQESVFQKKSSEEYQNQESAKKALIKIVEKQKQDEVELIKQEMKNYLNEMRCLSHQKCTIFVKKKALQMKVYPYELKNLLAAYEIVFKMQDLKQRGESNRMIFQTLSQLIFEHVEKNPRQKWYRMSKIVQIIFKNIHLNENKVAPFLKLTMNEHDRYGKLKYFKILDSIEKITQSEKSYLKTTLLRQVFKVPEKQLNEIKTQEKDSQFRKSRSQKRQEKKKQKKLIREENQRQKQRQKLKEKDIQKQKVRQNHKKVNKELLYKENLNRQVRINEENMVNGIQCEENDSMKQSSQLQYPPRFQRRISQKLDKILEQKIQSAFSQKSQEACMNLKTLKRIYSEHGKYKLTLKPELIKQVPEKIEKNGTHFRSQNSEKVQQKQKRFYAAKRSVTNSEQQKQTMIKKQVPVIKNQERLDGLSLLQLKLLSYTKHYPNCSYEKIFCETKALIKNLRLNGNSLFQDIKSIHQWVYRFCQKYKINIQKKESNSVQKEEVERRNNQSQIDYKSKFFIEIPKNKQRKY